jgi:Ca2+-binding RTX toxin-like protein
VRTIGARLVVAAAAVAMMLAASPAHAATVAIVGSELLIGGGPESDDLSVIRTGTTYQITAPGGLSAGAGCSGGGTLVTCPDAGSAVVLIVIDVGGGDDRVSTGSATPVFVRGGPGNDVAFANDLTPSAVLIGGSGNDELHGSNGDDRIAGGSGRDQLDGSTGSDRLRGQGGPDRIFARDGEVDRVNGGKGKDLARVDRKDRVRAVERRIV